jgi:hypothetical protein
MVGVKDQPVVRGKKGRFICIIVTLMLPTVYRNIHGYRDANWDKQLLLHGCQVLSFAHV